MSEKMKKARNLATSCTDTSKSNSRSLKNLLATLTESDFTDSKIQVPSVNKEEVQALLHSLAR